jgi:hypothetical protein
MRRSQPTSAAKSSQGSTRRVRLIYQISDTVSDKALMILRAADLVETLPGVGVFVK